MSNWQLKVLIKCLTIFLTLSHDQIPASLLLPSSMIRGFWESSSSPSWLVDVVVSFVVESELIQGQGYSQCQLQTQRQHIFPFLHTGSQYLNFSNIITIESVDSVGRDDPNAPYIYNLYTKITVVCPSMRAVGQRKPSNPGIKSFISLQSLSLTLHLVAH